MLHKNILDMNTNRKLEIERDFLIRTRELLKAQIGRDVNYERHNFLDVFTLDKINKLIDRMIDSELDYLVEETDEYFELCCKDHLKN